MGLTDMSFSVCVHYMHGVCVFITCTVCVCSVHARCVCVQYMHCVCVFSTCTVCVVLCVDAIVGVGVWLSEAHVPWLYH